MDKARPDCAYKVAAHSDTMRALRFRPMTRSNWRTPLAVLICGGFILTLSLGTRHTFGLYLQPMTIDLGWSRETFAIAIAIQNLV